MQTKSQASRLNWIVPGQSPRLRQRASSGNHCRTSLIGRRFKSMRSSVLTVAVILTSNCAIAQAPALSKPDNVLIQKLQRDTEPAEPETLRFFGNAALNRKATTGIDTIWLIALQKLGGEYCVFYEARADLSQIKEVTAYEGCVIEQVIFDDFDQDGMMDALYKLNIPSNQHAAKVQEEVLFLSAGRASGFCRSIRTPKFNSDPRSLRCP